MGRHVEVYTYMYIHKEVYRDVLSIDGEIHIILDIKRGYVGKYGYAGIYVVSPRCSILGLADVRNKS